MARPAISDETFAVFLKIARDAHSLVRARDRSWEENEKTQLKAYMKEPLPDFDTCMKDPRLSGEILQRVWSELVYKQGEESRQAVGAARTGVERILQTKRDKLVAACVQYDATDPDVREMYGMAKRPESLPVPVSSLVGCFPKGTTLEQAVAHLKTMGYNLVKGPQHKDGPRVEVKAPSKAITPPPAHGAAVNAEIDAEIAAKNAVEETSDDAPVSEESAASA
jgi:hypothetical protein